MVLKKLKVGHNNTKRNTVLLDYKKTLVPPTTKAPRSLFTKIKNVAGRSSHSGRVTMHHRKGFGHRREYRIIDFARNTHDNIPGTIESIERDPIRDAFISRVSYANGARAFILTPEGIKVGDKIISGDKDIPIEPGNSLPLTLIPANVPLHNIELRPGKGGQLMRSAGTWGEVIAKDEDLKYVTVKLKSKEVRKILGTCRATIGRVSNSENNLIRRGKAGRATWTGGSGSRPKVRSSAKNPRDAPMGGGEGKAGAGMSSPKDRWGNKVFKKTRRRSNPTDKFIVRRRTWFKNKENR